MIPDEWLVHKSTKTGQESFLPADKILTRIKKIKELKENNTLKEIADLLSPELVEKKYEKSIINYIDWIDDDLLRTYEEIIGTKKHYSFNDIVYLKVLHRLKKSGESARNTYLALETLDSLDDEAYELDQKIILARRKPEFQKNEKGQIMDSGFCLIATGEVQFDPSIKVAKTLNLPELVRELKLEMRETALSNE